MIRAFKPGFEKMATVAGRMFGNVWAFGWAFLIVVVWMIARPLFTQGDIWQMTGDSVTGTLNFLMLFLIQISQDKDTRAIHVKLDEIICTLHGHPSDVSNHLDLEDLSEDELKALQKRYRNQILKAVHESKLKD